MSGGNRYSDSVSHFALMKATNFCRESLQSNKNEARKMTITIIVSFLTSRILVLQFLQVLSHWFHNTFQNVIWLRREKQIYARYP